MTKSREGVDGAQESPEAMRERVEAAEKAFSELIYVVSHDLRAPLRGIHSLSDWLGADYADNLDEQGQEIIQLLQGRVLRLTAMIDALLAYSRVGRFPHHPKEVHVGELLERVFDQRAEGAPVLSGTFPVLFADPDQLIYVFQELVNNARRYSEAESLQLEIEARSDGQAHTLLVRDNGKGIPDTSRDRVFQLFQTLQAPTGHEQVGMGLPTCRKILESYGGGLTIAEGELPGLCMQITWPRGKE